MGHRKDNPPFHEVLAALDGFGRGEIGALLGLDRDRVALHGAPDTRWARP